MRLLTTVSTLACLAAPAFAQEAEPAYNPLYDGAPEWRVGENASFKLRGRFLYDFAEIGNDFDIPAADISDSEIRALRLGAEFETGDLKLKAEFDFADDAVQPTDVLAAYAVNKLLTLQAGHYKEHVSLDEQTSSRFTTFMERGSITDAFDIERRIGVSAIASGDNWSWSSGLFGGTMDEFDVQDDSWAAASRVTFAPVADAAGRTWAHLGASIRYRENDEGGLFRYRQRPLAHLADRYVATPGFAEDDLWLGAEGAIVRGPVHAQAEYAHLSAEGPLGEAGYDGGYVQAGWFLTGESRTYEPSEGAFDRTRPQAPLGRGGFGALELAARLDTIDLSDEGFTGGDQDSVTLGLNWYPTARLRFTANYVAADIENGPFGGGESEVIQFRGQIDW